MAKEKTFVILIDKGVEVKGTKLDPNPRLSVVRILGADGAVVAVVPNDIVIHEKQS